MTLSKETLNKVWRYINALPKDTLDNSIDFKYETHSRKLNISETDLGKILEFFEMKGLIIRAGYLDGAIIMFR